MTMKRKTESTYIAMELDVLPLLLHELKQSISQLVFTDALVSDQ